MFSGTPQKNIRCLLPIKILFFVTIVTLQLVVVVPCNEFSYFFAFFSFGGRKSTSVASGGDGGIQSLFPRILTHLGSCTSTTTYCHYGPQQQTTLFKHAAQ